MFGVKAKVNGPVQRPLGLKAGLRYAFANRCRWWEPSRRDSKWKFPLNDPLSAVPAKIADMIRLQLRKPLAHCRTASRLLASTIKGGVRGSPFEHSVLIHNSVYWTFIQGLDR